MNKHKTNPKGKSRMDNPDTLAVFEHKNKTKNRQKTIKTKNTIQKTKKMSNTDPT